MEYFIYFVEGLFTVIGISIGFFYLKKLFEKKFNIVTSIIFTFIALGFFVYILAPYIMSFSKPSLFYLPVLMFWLVYYLYQISKET